MAMVLFCQCGSDKVDVDKWDNQRMLLKCFTCERTAWVDGFTVRKLDFVEQGSMDKLATMMKILKQEGLTEKEACFVGDDIVDVPVMRRCGLAIAVPNARKEVIDEAHYVTKCAGGEGAARDAIEYILRAQGRLKAVMEKYLSTHSGVAAGN